MALCATERLELRYWEKLCVRTARRNLSTPLHASRSAVEQPCTRCSNRTATYGCMLSMGLCVLLVACLQHSLTHAVLRWSHGFHRVGFCFVAASLVFLGIAWCRVCGRTALLRTLRDTQCVTCVMRTDETDVVGTCSSGRAFFVFDQQGAVLALLAQHVGDLGPSAQVRNQRAVMAQWTEESVMQHWGTASPEANIQENCDANSGLRDVREVVTVLHVKVVPLQVDIHHDAFHEPDKPIELRPLTLLVSEHVFCLPLFSTASPTRGVV